MDELSAALSRLRMPTGDYSGVNDQIRIDEPRLRWAQRWRRIRTWSVFAAGVIAFAGVAFEMTRERTPARVAVLVEPATATIFVDGKAAGPGPRRLLTLPPGRHFVWAEQPGYLAQQRELRLGEGQPLELSFALQFSPATGFELTSEPTDLPIWLDGAPLLRTESEEQARTDYTARRLRPGHHVVEVRDGTRVWRQEITVEPDRILPLTAKLPDKKAEARRLRASGPRR
jgi:hypothetical protein